MKKIIAMIAVELMCVAGVMAQEVKTVCEPSAPNPFIYQSGKLSLGIVSGDTLALYDIFKHVDGITSRVGGSVTLAQYDRLGMFVGAAAPTSDPSAVALVAGPSINLDDVAKSSAHAILGALPFNIDNTTMDNLSKAARLKIYMGYDFRFRQLIAGAGLGFGLF